ncbi:Regulator of nucleoside diphosphate kinase [Achromobacter insolitus]|uniref:bifunctional GNAT family N-acetyltransferase/nucleoside diphosphate kinase regulator n=1 Tax=Achromobacter insolitus TaxID=217204 RepID=UPI000972D1FB|nr:bifunctional GNAT family N-acetyltransferase/nucleoside diphosphate kinase regulator [Achromobacter insolitus]APX78491.1 GNAT family N-acetyltransferase [Achromobacter insolitus]MDQ6211716.1 GNAT family N-acetyltransferase [Achromobacter insolitus]OWT62986.1 GNAT family N-acetyltransferase [Achromobacter insolitus]CAB3651449.1 Regulator of nucleoside diphosphate kinase [Achromobacter insolitus]CAB3955755.1 Regulator of nucleoside diphosphate kinase [Achromobacter insolitus]
MAIAMKGFHPLQISVVKMNKPFISLCPEITRAHALTLMDWLEDERVTCYLSDSRHVSRFIEQAINRTQLPILTHLFNQGGRFFMAYDRRDTPVGFVRLVKTGPDCEIVLVIGDSDNWGQNLGASTIREGMKLAFLDMRSEKLIAKIHPDNVRSLKAFLRTGFLLESETPTLKSLSLTAGRYLRLLREGVIVDSTDIYITEIDKARLKNLIELEYGPAVVELEHEIERAIVVKPEQVAGNVVTMNSRALLQLDDEEMEVALVYPEDADSSAGKFSVCSDVGAAILGYREGDAIDWRISDRTRRIGIRKVLYQPEAAGDFHL